MDREDDIIDGRIELEKKAAELETEARAAFEAKDFALAGSLWAASLLARKLADEEAHRTFVEWRDRPQEEERMKR